MPIEIGTMSQFEKLLNDFRSYNQKRALSFLEHSKEIQEPAKFFEIAIQNDWPDCIEALATKNRELVENFIRTKRPLGLACEKLHYLSVKKLLDLGANPNSQNKGRARLTPLIVTILNLKNDEKAAEKIVELLILAQVNVDASAAEGENIPLLDACKQANSRIVDLLLSARASTRIADLNQNLMSVARSVGNPIVIDLLLDAGAEENFAVLGSKPELFEKILAESGYVGEIIERTNLNGCDTNGNTALMICVTAKQDRVMHKLFEYDIDIDMQNRNGFSALMFAALIDDTDAVEFLLSKRARTDLECKFGATAADYAAAVDGKAAEMLSNGKKKNAFKQIEDHFKEYLLAGSTVDELFERYENDEYLDDTFFYSPVFFADYLVSMPGFGHRPPVIKNWAAILSNMPDPGRFWYAQVNLEGQIKNGGYDQYFFNFGIELLPFALQGYKILGLKKMYENVTKALTLFLREKKDEFAWVRSLEKPIDQLDNFMTSYDGTFDDLDKQFYEMSDKISEIRKSYLLKWLKQP